MNATKQIRRAPRAGYSLVEVTLALLVVAIGLTATFALFPEGLKSTRAAVSDTEMGLFAEYVFSTLDLTAGLKGGTWTIQQTDLFKSAALARPSKVSDQSKFQLEVNKQSVFYWIPDYYGLAGGGDYDAAGLQNYWTSAFTYELELIEGGGANGWKYPGAPGVRSAVLKVWPGEYVGVTPKAAPRIFYREILPLR